MRLQLFHLTCKRGHLHLGVRDRETAARRSCPGGHSARPDIRPATLLLRGSGQTLPKARRVPTALAAAPNPRPSPLAEDQPGCHLPITEWQAGGWASVLSPSLLQSRPDQAARLTDFPFFLMLTVLHRAFLH